MKFLYSSFFTMEQVTVDQVVKDNFSKKKVVVNLLGNFVTR